MATVGPLWRTPAAVSGVRHPLSYPLLTSPSLANITLAPQDTNRPGGFQPAAQGGWRRHAELDPHLLGPGALGSGAPGAVFSSRCAAPAEEPLWGHAARLRWALLRHRELERPLLIGRRARVPPLAPPPPSRTTRTTRRRLSWCASPTCPRCAAVEGASRGSCCAAPVLPARSLGALLDPSPAVPLPPAHRSLGSLAPLPPDDGHAPPDGRPLRAAHQPGGV